MLIATLKKNKIPILRLHTNYLMNLCNEFMILLW